VSFAHGAAGDEPPLVRVRPAGPRSAELAARLAELECPAFGHRREQRARASGAEMTPIVLTRAVGSNVHDADDNRYVDLVAGFGAVVLGHGAAPIARAVAEQAGRLVQGLGDVYASDTKLALLERLARLGPGPRTRVLLGQSGADALTAAIKTAALVTGRAGIVAFEGAYHGLGYAPLAACGLRESYRAPFAAQLNPTVRYAPYPRDEADVSRALDAVEAALRPGDVGAVIVEPILGRGGCVVPPPGFLAALRGAAHRAGALLVADEVWTGVGRSGAMAYAASIGVEADVLCLGKALGGGLPISACLASEAIMGAWAREAEVVHTSTHAGAPLACAAAVATLDAVTGEGLAARAAEVGARFQARLRAALAGAAAVVDVRGAGLMIGVELASGATALAAGRAMLERGYLVLGGGTRGEVLTLTPPLTIAEPLLDAAADALAESLRDLAPA
jgi:4-aminobutyrate aminotransferase/(S)-3-amino-2-methylpropionate transaminase